MVASGVTTGGTVMKQHHARSIAFVLTVLLPFYLTAAPASALTFPGSGGSSGPVYLCGAADDIDKKIIVLEAGEPVSTHFSKIPANGEAWIYFATNGSMQMVPVYWQTDDPALLGPGLHVMNAQATTSSSILLAEGYDGIVTWPVFRKGDNAVLQLQSLQTPGIRNRLIAEGCDTSSLHETLQLTEHVTECKVSDYWLLDTKNDPAFRWVWDTSAVDSGRMGYQPVTATLEHPDWVAVPEEYCRFSEAVFVMPDNRIELWAPVSVDLNGKLTFRWLYDAQNVTGAALQWKTLDTAYQPCDENWYTFISANSASSGSLLLNLRKLPVNNPLTFQLSYYDTIDGVTTQHFTEPVTITVPENLDELLRKNITVILDELTGDRDGGDRDETTLPDYSQPAPVTPPEESEDNNKDDIEDEDADNKNNSTESSGNSGRFDNSDNTAFLPVQETVTDTCTEISGKRLTLLISLGDSVLFEKQGISAEIPSALLEHLALTENQLLKVTLLHPDVNTVQISVLADGQHVNDLTGTVITMPWKLSGNDDNTVFFCSDHTGKIMSPAVYDAQHGIIRFAINAPGTWHIIEQPVTAATETGTDNTSVAETLPNDEKESIDNTDSNALADIPEKTLDIQPENTSDNNLMDETDVSAITDTSDTKKIAVLIPVVILALAGGAVLLFAGRWRR